MIIQKKGKEPRLNNSIQANEVRLIGSKGEKHGIVTLQKALELAKEQGLDLVEVAPNVEPPVCRFVDYGRFKYDHKRKKHEAKKKQVIVRVKEVQLSLKIGVNDLFVKLNNVMKFLKGGNKSKLVVMFKGREMAYKGHAKIMLGKVVRLLESVAVVELEPKIEGRRMMMILAPIAVKKGESDDRWNLTVDMVAAAMKEQSPEEQN